MSDAVDIHARLRLPFPASQVGKLPKGGTTLDYVGHGAVTDRLLSVDPGWNWEPLGLTEAGLPAFDLDDRGNPVGLWIKLTVGGTTRLGYGSCNSGQFEATKVLIGDAIRNAAMRFGVALDLWIKGHAEDDEKVSSSAPTVERGQAKRPECPACNEPLKGKAVKDEVTGAFVHEACAVPA
jgi:hypothetical protein